MCSCSSSSSCLPASLTHAVLAHLRTCACACCWLLADGLPKSIFANQACKCTIKIIATCVYTDTVSKGVSCRGNFKRLLSRCVLGVPPGFRSVLRRFPVIMLFFSFLKCHLRRLLNERNFLGDLVSIFGGERFLGRMHIEESAKKKKKKKTELNVVRCVCLCLFNACQRKLELAHRGLEPCQAISLVPLLSRFRYRSRSRSRSLSPVPLSHLVFPRRYFTILGLRSTSDCCVYLMNDCSRGCWGLCRTCSCWGSGAFVSHSPSA